LTLCQVIVNLARPASIQFNAVLAQCSNVLFLQSYNVLFSNADKGTLREWMNY
jgi:hypothetical protein